MESKVQRVGGDGLPLRLYRTALLQVVCCDAGKELMVVSLVVSLPLLLLNQELVPLPAGITRDPPSIPTQ